MNLDLCRRSLLSADKNASRRHNDSNDSSAVSSMSITSPRRPKTAAETLQQDFRRHMLSTMCNVPLDSLDENGEVKTMLPFGDASSHVVAERRHGQIGVAPADPNAVDFLHSTKFCNEMMKPCSKNKSLRKISDEPYRVLDAPEVVNNFYCDLMSWSQDNILAVGLCTSVWLWHAATSEVHHFEDFGEDHGYPTSLKWCPIPGMTHILAIGTYKGFVFVYDTLKRKFLCGFLANEMICKLSWNSSNGLLSCGDAKGFIHNFDIRLSSRPLTFVAHRNHSVCGLSWNAEGT